MLTARSSVALAAFLLAAKPVSAQPLFGCAAGALYPEALCPQEPLFLPEGFVMTRAFARKPGEKSRTSPDPAPLDSLRDVPARLAACWTPPAGPGQITVRLSFSTDGRVIGVPTIPFTQAGTDEGRRTLRETLRAAIRACTPLRFTPSLGPAIAGRIFAIRFVLPDR